MRAHPGITDLGDGRYKVTVSCGFAGGKRIRRCRTVRGLRVAIRTRAALMMESGRPPESDLTFHDYCLDVWLPAKKAGSCKVRQRTYDGYERDLTRHAYPYFGTVPLRQLKPLALTQWLDRLEASGATAHVIARAYRTVRSALKQAEAWDLIERSPTDKVPAPETPERDLDVLSAEEANAYLDAFAGHRCELVVTLAIAGGFRLSEMAGLTWADVDFRDSEVRIRRGLHETSGGLKLEDPKSRRSRRDVSMPEWAMEVLRAHRSFGRILTGNPSSVSQAYRRTLRETKLRYVPLRDLRHSHATLALAEGAELVAVSRRMGHASVSTTDRFYLAPKRAADVKVAATIEGIRCQQVPHPESGEAG